MDRSFSCDINRSITAVHDLWNELSLEPRRPATRCIDIGHDVDAEGRRLRVDIKAGEAFGPVVPAESRRCGIAPNRKALCER